MSERILISSALDALLRRLDRARTCALQASAGMTAGDQNLAVGSILDLDRLLPECDALYRTVLVLHCSRHGKEAP